MFNFFLVISDLPPSLFYALKTIPKLSIDLLDNKLSRFNVDTFYPNSTWDAVGTRSEQPNSIELIAILKCWFDNQNYHRTQFTILEIFCNTTYYL